MYHCLLHLMHFACVIAYNRATNVWRTEGAFHNASIPVLGSTCEMVTFITSVLIYKFVLCLKYDCLLLCWITVSWNFGICYFILLNFGVLLELISHLFCISWNESPVVILHTRQSGTQTFFCLTWWIFIVWHLCSCNDFMDYHLIHLH